MTDLATPGGHRAAQPLSPAAARLSPAPAPAPAPGPTGVRGWLLLLCLMFTAIGPLISVWLLVDRSGAAAPGIAASGGLGTLQLASWLSWALGLASILVGMRAGWHLWTIRPGAVATARAALLLGLAVDAVTTVLQLATGSLPSGPGQAVWVFNLQLLPDLLFFTLCLAYLNKSRRVQATYATV